MSGEFQVTYWPIGRSRYRVEHEGETLVESCAEPLTASAVALLELGGVDPDDTIVTISGALGMRCLSAKISTAIALARKYDT